ncbi:MAG: hypothetical protein AAGH57_04280 [Pseudomonadota bacterium]
MGKSCAHIALIAGSSFILGCSAAPEEGQGSAAADYAARINAEKASSAEQAALAPVREGVSDGMREDAAAPPLAAQAPEAAPSVAQPLNPVAPGAFAPGTATDPNSACNANAFGEFLGQKPDAEVRAAIMDRAIALPEVRFIAPGSEYIKPDPTHPRLNVMIAVDGVIRDIRCG